MPAAVTLKLLLVGESAVGKTCLLLRYTDATFSPTYITTIGIDFRVRRTEVDGTPVRLQLWDTAGQERFRCITESYYRGAHAVVLVYDVCSRASFDSVRQWARDVQARMSRAPTLLLLGNKCDLGDGRREVAASEGEAMAASLGCAFFETSARRDVNVTVAFEAAARAALHRLRGASGTGAGTSSTGTSTSAGTSTSSVVVLQPQSAARSCCV